MVKYRYIYKEVQKQWKNGLGPQKGLYKKYTVGERTKLGLQKGTKYMIEYIYRAVQRIGLGPERAIT